MNSFDIAVLSVMAVTVIIGALRGAVREVFSTVSVVAGGLIAMHFNSMTSGALIRLTSHPEVNEVVSFLLIFVFAAALISYAGGHFSAMINKTGFKLWNMLGGPVLGGLKGLIICTLVTFMLMVLLPQDSKLTSGSVVYPHISKLARLISPVAPESFRKDMDRKLERVKDGIRLPDALDAVMTYAPDLILLDMMLPFSYAVTCSRQTS